MNKINTALGYLDAGFSLVPVSKTSKRALVEWKKFQQRLPTAEEVTAWFTKWPEANIAIICGKVSGNLAVIDTDAPDALKGYEVPETVTVKTGRGYHYYFKTDSPVPCAGGFLPKVDLKAERGYVIAPPSTHSSGTTYKEVDGLGFNDIEMAALPEWAVKALRASNKESNKEGWAADVLAKPLEDGTKHDTLVKLAGRYSRIGMEPGEIKALLVNHIKASGKTVDEKEVERIVIDIYSRNRDKPIDTVVQGRDEGGPKGLSLAPCKTLEDVKKVFRKWLYLKGNEELIDVMLCGLVINRWDCDPVWLIFIGPSGSAKTEILNAARSLQDDTYFLSDLTGKTFISGKKGKDPSILKDINGRVLIFKDFTTLLAKRAEEKREIFSQLREIYDGEFARGTGETGRRVWDGRIGFMAGVTGAIDAEANDMSLFGQRYLCSRIWQDTDDEEYDNQVYKMVSNSASKQRQKRSELQDAVASFMSDKPSVKLDEVELPEGLSKKVFALCVIGMRMRMGINRNPYTREIVSDPEREGVGRVAGQTLTLVRALAHVRGRKVVHEDDYLTLARMFMASIPLARLKIVRFLVDRYVAGEGQEWATTQDVAEAIGRSRADVRLKLYDLHAIGVVSLRTVAEKPVDDNNGQKVPGSNSWTLRPSVADQIVATKLVEFFYI